LKIDVVTLFPEVLEPALGASIVGRAVQSGKVEFKLVQLRDFTHDRHNTGRRLRIWWWGGDGSEAGTVL
jgi:tRNA (guanine37-N1)-methyltransferase